MKVLILSGSNHGFDKSAPLIGDFLGAADDLDISLADSKDALTSSLDRFDVCVFGTGFTHAVRDGDGPVRWEAELVLAASALPAALRATAVATATTFAVRAAELARAPARLPAFPAAF